MRFTILIFTLLLVLSCRSRDVVNESLENTNCSKIHSLGLSKKDLQLAMLRCERKKSFDHAVAYFSDSQKEDIEDENNKQKIDNLKRQNIPSPYFPDVSSSISKPSNKMVTINTGADSNVEDILSDIGYMTGIDIEINGKIDKEITFVMKNKPVEEAFKSIAYLAGLRYDYKNGIAKFEVDTPYIKNYQINFLDIVRTGSDSYGVGTGFTSSESIGSGSSTTGVTSSSSISNTNEWSVWNSLDVGLKQIINGDNSYTLNKQAGIVTVNASQSVHKLVDDYLKKAKKYAMSQVLVEVKIVEVDLDDEYKTGLSFAVNGNSNSSNLTNSFASQLGTVYKSASAAGSNQFFSASLKNGSNLDLTVNLLQQFGFTKVLSSPRLNVVNNQKAVLSFVTNQVYFKITPQLQNQFVTTAVTNPATPIIISSEAKTVPIGIILTLQAVIDPDNDEITMNVRPSLSSSSSFVTDPAASFLSAYAKGQYNISDMQITNQIPVVQKKELDSVLKIKNGGIMVIGGFTDQKISSKDTGIPFFMNIPFLGNLFKSKEEITSSVETVIFIKATIIDPESGLEKKDSTFYKTF